MTTGANFKVEDGIILWYRPLISGDELLIQDHEARMKTGQLTYRPYPQFGNPFIDVLSSEISIIERNMLLIANIKECTRQDVRLLDGIVDEASIVDEGKTVRFNYTIIKRDGGVIERNTSL